MNLQTKYMGLELDSPFILSASPIGEDLGNIKKLEDLGIGAIVLHSLFEEQLVDEQFELEYHLTHGTDSFAEAISYFPSYDEFHLVPDLYLEHIRKAKESVKVPIIASLNGTTLGGWTKYAKKMEEAGADAIELNIYNIPTDINLSSEQIENTYVKILQEIKSILKIPVAVKLSPYFTSIANVIKRMDDSGANAFVLFNRFYQPDINLETLAVEPKISLSTSADTRVQMRWIAILKDKIKADFAANGGIINAIDVAKVLLAGASAAQMFATLAKNGFDYLDVIKTELVQWMDSKGYESVSEMIGVASQKNIPNPSAFERSQYMKALTGYNLKF